MKKTLVFGFAFAFALLLVSPAAQENTAAIFPMEKGTTWVYRAKVKTARAGNKGVDEKDLRWNTSVGEFVQTGQVSAALLKADWNDLASFDESAPPSEILVVRIGDAYYLVRTDAREIIALIKSGKTERLDDKLADDIWFRLPLKTGDTACSPDQEGTAPMYCWHVEGEGKDSPGAFQLAYRTNPDHTLLTLTPGKGVTHWEYAHNGTISEATLDLLEFHPGGVSPRAPASK